MGVRVDPVLDGHAAGLSMREDETRRFLKLDRAGIGIGLEWIDALGDWIGGWIIHSWLLFIFAFYSTRIASFTSCSFVFCVCILVQVDATNMPLCHFYTHSE